MLESGYTSLRTETIYSLLAQFTRMGIKEILFYGGEPTLHPEFPKFVLYAAKRSFKIRIITNGSQLFRPALAESIRTAAGLSEVTVRVSLNAGTLETHNQLHGCRGVFPEIVRGMQALTAGDSRVHLWLSFLVQEANAGEIGQAFELAARAKAECLALRPLTGQHGIGLVELSPQARQVVLAALNGLYQRDQPRLFFEPWYLEYLRANRLPALSKPYPSCWYCGNSRLIVTPPEPGVAWACTYWRGERRFRIASLAEFPLGSPEFEQRRVQVVRQILPGRDCAQVICNRNAENKAIWETLGRTAH
jgi:MoaA/NifB/PqqE/SkfB family radical SAM enzyme